MIKQTIIDIPPVTEEDKARWNNLNPKNYEKVIWQSIEDYNHRAQLDIAEILYKQLLELGKDKRQNTSIAKNLAFRIMQLFFEAADQFALVYMCVIDNKIRPVFETYVEGSNVKTKDFFIRCLDGKIRRKEILRVWGLEKLNMKSISNMDMRNRMQVIADDIVVKTQKNLKMFGNTYAEYDKKSKKSYYSSSLLGSFAIKHGYKQITPNELSKSIWKFDSEEPTIIEGLVEMKRADNNEVKKVIKVGSLYDSKKRSMNDICKRMIEHIAFFSREIQTVANIQLSLIDDQYGSLTLFAKNGILKIGRNDLCPCNSSKKWKRCHGKNL